MQKIDEDFLVLVKWKTRRSLFVESIFGVDLQCTQMRWSKWAGKRKEDISSHSQFVAFFQVLPSWTFLPQISGLGAFVGKVFASRQEIEKLALILNYTLTPDFRVSWAELARKSGKRRKTSYKKQFSWIKEVKGLKMISLQLK